jgi:hypothetical protein
MLIINKTTRMIGYSKLKQAINANPSKTTSISLFFATNRYKPRMSFNLQPDPEPLLLSNSKKAKERKRAKTVAKAIKNRSKYLQKQITLANSRIEQYANTSRQLSPNYQPSDKV